MRDAENSYLTYDGTDADPDSPINQLLGSSITYRIAVGPQQGRKVFTLQTLPDCRPDNRFVDTGQVAGFSLHAGVATRAHERDKLERLCRYITRPAVATQRLSMTRNGAVRYELKTPYSDGTTHILFEPLDFIARLVALVPKPRVNLTRFHGVFAPHSKYRARVTPARRGKGRKIQTPEETPEQTPAERRASMTGFCSCKTGIHAIPGNNLGTMIDTGIQNRHCLHGRRQGARAYVQGWTVIGQCRSNCRGRGSFETCSECGGAVKAIASIEDPVAIKKILAHLKEKIAPAGLDLLPPCRAPPATGLFD